VKPRRVCKVCRERPATAPDPAAGSLARRAEVCAGCHAGRLRKVDTKGEVK
jgi:hypothetical protein